MRIFYVNDFFIRWSAIIISTLAHVMALQIIFVKFPLKPVPFKPDFIFLGGILNSVAEAQNTSSAILQNSRTDLSRMIRVSNLDEDNSHSALIKPINLTATSIKKKIFLKTDFLERAPRTSEPKNTQDKISPPLNTNPYRPLRLHQP